MTTELIGYLLDFGALGAFCAFLVWSHVQGGKRLDSITATFQAQLETLTARFDQREELIRSRYDQIIERQRTAKEHIIGDVVNRLSSQERKLDETLGRVDGGLAEMRAEVGELKLEMARFTAGANASVAGSA